MDARDRAAMRGGAPEKLVMEIYDENGDYLEIELPQKFGVCELCEGKGTHVNPSIDAHGISAEEFAEDPEFAESYWRGEYDQPCNECHGNRVVPVVDEDRCDPELLKKYISHCRVMSEMYYTEEAERRMGA